MLPSGNTDQFKEDNSEDGDEYATGKENINKKRKRLNNVKNGSRVPIEHSLCELPPSKRLNMEIDEENVEELNNKMSSGKSNFSSFTNNHMNDRSPLANSKTTGAKKLVIKNFKGLYISTFYYHKGLLLHILLK